MDTEQQKSDQQCKGQEPQTPTTIISKHTYWAVATGMIPIPIIDIASVTAVQLDMLKKLSEHYKLDYSEVQVKSLIGTLTASTMARFGASALKAIPVVGTVLGITSMAILSGASTYAIGHVFNRHFDEGGTLKDFDIDILKKFYEEKVEEGKEYAKSLIDKFKAEVKQGEELSATKRLKELSKMHKKGLISKEEYNNLREEILRNFTQGM